MYCHQNYDADFFSFLIGAGLLSYSSPKEDPITEPPIVENTKVEDNIKFYSQAWDQIMNQGKLELFNDSIFIPDVLFKNKIAPDPFFQMFYDLDIQFALVDVAEVAESIFQAATTEGLHGNNYLLSSETYLVSDITMMLNNQEPAGKSKIVYSNALAERELGVSFKSARESLASYPA